MIQKTSVCKIPSKTLTRGRSYCITFLKKTYTPLISHYRSGKCKKQGFYTYRKAMNIMDANCVKVQCDDGAFRYVNKIRFYY